MRSYNAPPIAMVVPRKLVYVWCPYAGLIRRRKSGWKPRWV